MKEVKGYSVSGVPKQKENGCYLSLGDGYHNVRRTKKQLEDEVTIHLSEFGIRSLVEALSEYLPENHG